MSTNALIGIYRNGNVKFVYCHYDGYEEHVGYLLKKYYNTRKLVNELIKLGDISVLGKYLHPNKDLPHNMGDKQKDVTFFYGRDNRETDCNAKVVSLENYSIIPHIEYNYLFKDGEWLVKRGGSYVQY